MKLLRTPDSAIDVCLHGLVVVWTVFTAAAPALADSPLLKPTAVSCSGCHEEENRQFTESVHGAAGMECRDCHGGQREYYVLPAVIEQSKRLATRPQTPDAPEGPPLFDHGITFLGKPSRFDIPERCGTCHADVSRMNPFGLPTDQLAQYRTSGHGRALYEKRNERAAVCTDCHGIHDVLKPKDTASPVFPKNVPATCGRCHSDHTVMVGTSLSTEVVEQYRESVHGQALLEGGDTGMPHCATCHGSHSAVPPGFRDVGHVCGQCHQQEERNFLESPHARFDQFPRCVGCHTRSVDKRDHLISRMVSPPAELEKTYEAVRFEMPEADIQQAGFQEAFAAARTPAVKSFGTFCQRCHTEARESGHRIFFGPLDKRAVERGESIYERVRHAEIRFAATASRVDELARGVLLVREEAMMVEEMKTMIVGLAPLQHTLDEEKIDEAVASLDELADRANRSLDDKVSGLRWRRLALLPMWGFLAVFMSVLWIKYKRLKHAMVVPAP